MHYNYQLSISNIIIYLQYVQHVGQKLFQREINASGEPTSQVITNWDATRGTSLGQRGATRDKSSGTEVYIGSTITEFPNDTTVFSNLQHSTLAKNSNEKRKNTYEMSYYHQQITISYLYTLSPRKKNLSLNSKRMKITEIH